MPLTVDLRPGKMVYIGSKKVVLGPVIPPMARGDMHLNGTGNLNNMPGFTVFRPVNGRKLSQNQMLIDQEYQAIGKTNSDLVYYLRNAKTVANKEQLYSQLNDSYKIQVRAPKKPRLSAGGGG